MGRRKGSSRALFEGQRQAQAELTRIETRHRTLLEEANDVILYVARDGKILDANRAAEELYGRPREELVGLDIADLHTDKTRGATAADLEAAARSGRLVYETEHRRADGSPVPVEVSTRLVEAGAEPALLSIVRDISLRKRADARIVQLNRLLRTTSDVNQAIVRANDRVGLLAEACRILVERGGFRMAWVGLADPASGRVVPDAWAGEGLDYLDGFEVRLEDVPEGRGPTGTAIRTGRQVVVPDLAADSSVEPWGERMLAHGFRSSAAFPLRVHGEVAGVLTIYAAEPLTIGDEEISLLDELADDLGYAFKALEDRDERQRITEELRRSVERYRRLFEANPQPMWVIDRETLRFLAVNDTAVESYGYSREEFLSMTIADIRPPEERERPLAVAPSSQRGLQDVGVWSHLRKNGSRIEAEVTMQDLDWEGRLARLVLAHDVTKRKNLEAQFLQAQKMEAVGRLAGGVAHDFNNLLTVIQGYGEMLAATLDEDAVQRDQVAEILKAATRAASLTRQLLAFSRRQVLEMRVLDLGEVVGESEKMLRRLIGENIEFVVSRPDGPVLVRADPGQIEQVLMNLAVNSRDAMPGGGRLTIRMEDLDPDFPLHTPQEIVPPGRYVVLSVDDTGCGVDVETLSHIFEPFFTTKEKGKGTGLGLSTVFGIVKQSGGFLDVESAPGKGTTFRIFFPRVDSEGARVAPMAREVTTLKGSETILVVDDEDQIRVLVCASLVRLGYTTLEAASAEDALSLSARHAGSIDLLLTDVVLKGDSGRELADRLLALRPGIKVLYMSGYPDDVVVLHRVLEFGIAFLQKPFSPVVLARKVRGILDAPAPEPGGPATAV